MYSTLNPAFLFSAMKLKIGTHEKDKCFGKEKAKITLLQQLVAHFFFMQLVHVCELCVTAKMVKICNVRRQKYES